jgi:hypothetical protein
MHQSPTPQHESPIQEKSNFESEGPGLSLAPPAFQLMASDAAPTSPPEAPAMQLKASGGMPGDLVSGFAASTGHDLSDVNVHYNSDKPSSVGALAYAQGNDIHLGAGQEQHLAHEAAHVVQQREGRVQATTEVAGMPVNDNKGLESEADNMGAKAMQMKADNVQRNTEAFAVNNMSSGPIQRYTVPIEGAAPATAMTITNFIKLVEAEEAKYPLAEQKNTKLMISRIRKIFYGSKGWDEHLIPGAKDAQSPYGTPKERERSRKTLELTGPNVDFVDKEVYPVDGSGNRPDIYKNQEVKLETGGTNGDFCDIGHVFAGLDAYNHRQMVDGPGTINIDNLGGTTWTGDLGSVMAEAQMDYLNSGKKPTDAELQKKIDEYSPAQDMLGNIDAYSIGEQYSVGATSGGMKVSEILRDYYLGAGSTTKQALRYTKFSSKIGLSGWDGSKWSNEADMVDFWADEVNDAAAMYIGAGADYGVFSFAGTTGAVLGMSMNGGATNLVKKFFDALRTVRATEPK